MVMTPALHQDRAMHSNSLAARAGRWSAQHRWKAVLGWLALVIVAVVAGSATGQKSNDDYFGPGDSGQAERLIDAGYPDQAGESVLLQSHGAPIRGPEGRAAIGEVVRAVRAQPGVQEVKSPLVAANDGQISADGRSALVSFEVRGDDDLAEKRVDAV